MRVGYTPTFENQSYASSGMASVDQVLSQACCCMLISECYGVVRTMSRKHYANVIQVGQYGYFIYLVLPYLKMMEQSADNECFLVS